MEVASAVADSTSSRLPDFAISLVVQLGAELYAIPAAATESIVTMPHCVTVPHAPLWSRGVINLRDRVIPVVDARLRLGMKSLPVEIEAFAAMLEDRERDHVNWLNELESAIRERREFRLATDPHKCAFGKWYDTYKTDDLIIELFLQRFDEPHKRIHAIASVALEHSGRGDFESAYAIIETTRDGDLAIVRDLFENFRALIRSRISREIAIIIKKTDGSLLALAVDAIESVETIEIGMVEPVPEVGVTDRLLAGIVKRKGRKLAYLLDTRHILPGGEGGAGASGPGPLRSSSHR